MRILYVMGMGKLKHLPGLEELLEVLCFVVGSAQGLIVGELENLIDLEGMLLEYCLGIIKVIS
jgi:hypothetical protein